MIRVAHNFFLFLVIASLFIVVKKAHSVLASEQMEYAPQDPKFLYEKRFIPGNEEKFKTPHVQSQSKNKLESNIAEPGEKKSNGKNKKGKSLSVNLPNLAQTILLVSVFIVFVLYRIQVKNKKRSGNYPRK